MNGSRLDDALRKAHGMGLRVVNPDAPPMDSAQDECRRILVGLGAPHSLIVDCGRMLGGFANEQREEAGRRLARLMRYCRDRNASELELAVQDVAGITC